MINVTTPPKTSRGAEGMGYHDMAMLLDSVLHYIGPDIRRKVMSEVPKAYNAYCGSEIIQVVHTNDGRKVTS